MADQDRGNDGPSLELPSLGFGRKRKKTKAVEPAPEPAASAEPAAAAESEAAPEPAAALEPEPEPAPETAPTTILEADDRAPTPEPAPEPTPAPLYADEVDERPTRPEPVVPAAVPSLVPTPAVEPLADEGPGEQPQPARVKKPRRQRRPRRETAPVTGMAAAVVTGALVGVLTVGLTWLSLRLCEFARGTSSCGDPGFLLLVAILVAMVFLGTLLLRSFRVTDPGSTSFLAVGLLAVLALLFLVDVLFNWWMIIVIPLCSVATFALSHWVTATFVEPAEH